MQNVHRERLQCPWQACEEIHQIVVRVIHWNLSRSMGCTEWETNMETDEVKML